MSAEPVNTLVQLYADAARERSDRLTWLRRNPTPHLANLRVHYRKHLADWISDWCITVDPRNVRRGLPVVMPFLLDKRQREWVEFTVDNWQRGRYGLTVKSRDVGLSWLIVSLSQGVCTLFDNTVIGWGSFNALKVDRLGDMGSLFEKGRANLEALPTEFCAGYDARYCAALNRLLFPLSGGAILGEIGDNIGRGGRFTLYFVDETAHLEHDELVDAALSKATDVRQDVSTVFGMNNSFAIRAHQKSVLENGQRFDFDWHDNPRFTTADYDQFLESWGEVITAQELDRNFQASVEGIVLPAVWVNACIDAHVKLKLDVTGELRAALDVADEGIDKNALVCGHGVFLEHAEQWSGKQSDIGLTTEKAFNLCDLRGIRNLRYDADGIGAGVRGFARELNRDRAARVIAVTPFRGSAGVLDPEREMVPGRKNEDYFLNFKAQSWWWFRLRAYHTYRAVSGKSHDPAMLIAISSEIPELPKLLIELSQPTYSQNQAGKLLIDKQPDGKQSPNMADAAMMYYSPARASLLVTDEYLRRSRQLHQEQEGI